MRFEGPKRPAICRVPPAMRTADSIARDHTEEAIATIAEVMKDPFAENRDRVAAAKEILDRGHGKPNQAIIAVPGNRAIAALLSGKSDDELMAILNKHHPPRLQSHTPAIDAKFTEVDPPIDPLLL